MNNTQLVITYFYRPFPIAVSLECGAESLTVRLATLEPFTGRLFGRGGGAGCGVTGTGNIHKHPGRVRVGWGDF